MTTEKVRSWHGLVFEIEIVNGKWARLGFLPPHPQLVNLIIRRGLSRRIGDEMQILHEFGHVQAFPVVFIYFLPLYLMVKLGSAEDLIPAILGFFFFWEIAAEAYVFLKVKDYIKIYRKNLRVSVPLFWFTALLFALYPFVS